MVRASGARQITQMVRRVCSLATHLNSQAGQCLRGEQAFIEPFSALECPKRRLRLGTQNSVNRSRIEPFHGQFSLNSADRITSGGNEHLGRLTIDVKATGTWLMTIVVMITATVVFGKYGRCHQRR